MQDEAVRVFQGCEIDAVVAKEGLACKAAVGQEVVLAESEAVVVCQGTQVVSRICKEAGSSQC